MQALSRGFSKVNPLIKCANGQKKGITYTRTQMSAPTSGLFGANETVMERNNTNRITVKNPNWTAAVQLAIYKWSWEDKLNQGLPGTNWTSGQGEYWTRDLRISSASANLANHWAVLLNSIGRNAPSAMCSWARKVEMSAAKYNHLVKKQKVILLSWYNGRNLKTDISLLKRSDIVKMKCVFHCYST